MVFMVMEYCSGGSLFDKLVAKGGVDEQRAKSLFKQIVQSVDDCHKAGVVHRDLKPENLLIDYDESLKIVDFGLSNLYEPGTTLKTACGSPCYAAPEVSSHYSFIKPTFFVDDCWQALQRPHE